MIAYPCLYSLPLFIVVMLAAPRPSLDMTFAWCLLLSLPVNGVAFTLYMKAIKGSPLSLTLPYLAFTPVFMILTGWMVLGETLNSWGIFGIVATCIGSYILNLAPKRKSLLDPIASILREPGSRIMVVVALLFSVGAVLGKKGILHSSPLYFIVAFFTIFNALIPLVFWTFGKIRPATVGRYPFKGLTAGGLLFIQAVLHGYAISIAKAAYMISIKRFSILFGVLYGGLIFKEAHIPIRFSGATLMLSGAVLIVLKGN
jgi:drug/metabolite transporter (DMT)-like permease